ncbi:hypothetical protein EKN06_13725 [Croceicoccus ponticola]|uniref:Uncharacterized protein n=1 Tax=Croceicoccus ponticola TaxID=2217664 RepID=A0A437GWJ6_9SPHN|nr:hypothetical protein [Croceicoccus ponticola]RVQ65293.1 hypothetical protein EKN06_13725 [Croceicoccus ponticola]
MVFASQLFTDEDQERGFRAQVEGLLREGKPDQALAAVDTKLNEIAELPLAKLALAIDPDHVRITGWSAIAVTINSLDAHGQPISAVSIDFAGAADGDNSSGDAAAPALETSFYCDEVFPFSTSDRAAIVAGYGRAGARWQGGYEHLQDDIGVTGLHALYSAYLAVKTPMERGELTDLGDYDAPRLAAMRAAVLLHGAIAHTIEESGLPRPIAVLCGSNEAYPFFDAPVTSRAEYDDATDARAEAGDTDETLFTSLATLAPVRQNAGYHFTPETEHVSGRSLRHRFVRELQDGANDEEDAPAPQEVKSTSLLGRLFRRSA